ncbi:MAG: histidine kinase [Segetibacter sp.]|jgi:two-component system NtrC family sensor kinase|nr:histidine kinase [Segetibacter sp.]
MELIDVNIQYRVIIGISAMVILFTCFLISFVISQRKKLQYHKDLHALHEEQQLNLTQQNIELEKRVQQRTVELSHQKDELQKSLQQLNSTQLQLVQKEKMASLGELTAGIAHEIQNPLNFVNNFSEISFELSEELQKELKNCDREDAITLAELIQQNLQKINYHGKRADSIVKGMLEHSRVNTGQKESTDINILTEESLQLSYHGIKAKDKLFNASLETHFDGSIGKIKVIPQDIGRVLLNLFNNAFYAVAEKKRQQVAGFEPLVSVSTSLTKINGGNGVTISVKDNGSGIPQKILDKVFQPFFTTKPTGEGTGLGLSLSYDIIKAHGGELKVQTKEGEFTEFVIELPINEV